MAAFSSTRYFSVSPNLIQPIADDVARQLRADGYEVKICNLLADSLQISLSKGGMFKKVLGLQTALNLVLSNEGDSIKAVASVGIFGQQVIPAMIMLFITWPVILTQIVGLVKQSQLDDHVMDLIQSSITQLAAKANLKNIAESGAFCPNCGARISGGRFCSECGAKLI